MNERNITLLRTPYHCVGHWPSIADGWRANRNVIHSDLTRGL